MTERAHMLSHVREWMTPNGYQQLKLNAPAVVAALEQTEHVRDLFAERVTALEEALREIIELRLDTTPGVTATKAASQARIAMREIALAALRPGEREPAA